MKDNSLSVSPSLAQYFAKEKQALQTVLHKDLSPSQVVGEARRALDRTGLSFTRNVSDPQIQKSGLWLLEIIKSGVGILDRATHADVSLVETTPKKTVLDTLKQWRPNLFYGAATGLAILGLLQSSALTVSGALILAILHGISDVKTTLFSRFSFIKRPLTLSGPDARMFKPEASIRTDTAGFINQISEALSTADHILARLSQTGPDIHWRDDPAMLSMFQNLLEANATKDGRYALEVVGKDMKTVLTNADIEVVSYSKKTAHLFDELPALIINENDPIVEMAAPALLSKEGRLLRRGTIWVRRS